MKKTLPLLSLIVALGACEKRSEYILNQDVFCGERKQLACENKDVFCDNYTETFVCEDANGKGITGRVVNFYSNGNKQAEFFVKNGVVNGDLVYFYQDGKTISEMGTFKNGRLHGMVKEFDENGKTVSVTKYRNGEDIESTRYENGVLVGRVYSADNVTRYYNNNGRLTSEARTFVAKKDDNKEVVKKYDENGSLIQVSYYILKEMNTVHQSDATGEQEYVKYKVGTEEYKDGKLDGMRIRYIPTLDGKQVLYSEEWKNGQLNGVVKRYSVSGKLDEETTYENGIRNGINKVYFVDGSVRSTPYLHGFKHGTVEQFYPSGQLNFQENYKHGIRDGVYRGYSETGEITIDVLYKDGQIK